MSRDEMSGPVQVCRPQVTRDVLRHAWRWKTRGDTRFHIPRLTMVGCEGSRRAGYAPRDRWPTRLAAGPAEGVRGELDSEPTRAANTCDLCGSDSTDRRLTGKTMSATLASGDQGARHLLLERPERDGDGRLPATSSAALDSNFGVWVVRCAVGGAGGGVWVVWEC